MPLRTSASTGSARGQGPARRRRGALVAALVVLPLWLAMAAPATASGSSPAQASTSPTFSAASQQATWGDALAVSGAGWFSGTEVQISLLPDTITLGTATVADDGSFSTTVTVPEVRASRDYHLVATGQGADGLFAFVPVRLTIVGHPASVSVAADTLGWNEATVVRGEGFLSGSTAQVHLMPQSILLGEAQVAPDRRFEVAVSIPPDLASSREYQIVVTGAAADGQLTFVGAPITIIGPRPAIEVTAVPGSAAVDVSGVRFRRGTTAAVTLLPSSERLANPTVGEDGSFTVRVPLPESAAAGGVLAVTGEGADRLFAYLVWEIGPLGGTPTVIDPAGPPVASILPPRSPDDVVRSGPALRFPLESLLERLRPFEDEPDAESRDEVLLALTLLVLAVVGGWLLVHGLRGDLGMAVGGAAASLPLLGALRTRPRRERRRSARAGGGRRKMHPMVSGLAARLFSFGPTAIATFVAARLIITNAGIDAFNGYSLAISLMLLVPLHDMGVGSAIASAYASHGPRHRYAEGTLLTAGRVVGAAALAVAAVSGLLLVGDTWGRIVGPAVGDSTFFAFAMAIYAVSFIPALSQAILLGVHKTHYTILVRTLFTPMALVLVLVVLALDLHPRWFVVVPAVAQLLNNLVSARVASRAAGVSWSRLAARLPRPSRFPGERIRQIAGPRLVVSLTIPLALASDRIILSHRSTSIELTKYSVMMQIFGPVIALIAASAQPLWPIYVEARSQGRTGPRIGRIVAMFVAGTFVACAGLTLISRPVGHLVGGPDLDLGWALPLVASAAMLCGAVSFPLNVTLTTPQDLRFVAAVALVAVPCNIGLSIWLAGELGATGPPLATTIVALVVQIVPALLYLRWRSPEQRGFGQDAPEPVEPEWGSAEPGEAALAGAAGITASPLALEWASVEEQPSDEQRILQPQHGDR